MKRKINETFCLNFFQITLGFLSWPGRRGLLNLKNSDKAFKTQT